MAEQKIFEIGNAHIVVTSNNGPFSDGHTTGYLEVYGEQHRPAFLLTSTAIRDHLMTILNETSLPSLWKSGRITGWVEALIENAPHPL